MSDMAVNQDYVQPVRESHRGRRRGIAIGGGVLVVIVLFGLMYYVNAHSRYKVIGKVDPKTGFRIEYTVAKHFRTEFAYTLISDRYDEVPDAELENSEFGVAPAPSFLRWIYTQILHKPMTLQDILLQSNNAFNQTTIQSAKPYATTIDGKGFVCYVCCAPVPTNSSHSIERTIVSGCPATLCIDETHELADYHKIMRSYVLLVKPIGVHIVYKFSGNELSTSTAGIGEEILKIRDSIHVVKVK